MPAVNLDSPWGAGSTGTWGMGSAPLDPALFGGLSPNPYVAAQVRLLEAMQESYSMLAPRQTC